MSNHARAVFKNLTHDSEVYGAASESPPLSRIRLHRQFEGELAGESTAELLVCQVEADRFGYVGMDRFTGTLKGRAGSFVFQHGGKHDKGGLYPFGYIVPGSGTEQLQGLIGDVKISVTRSGEHSLDLTYAFESVA